jgi:glycosyltransferase involved in cell wall biosynthesis
VTILITFLSFAKDVFGGIENSICNLARGLQQNGVRVIVYTSYLGDEATEVDGIRTIRSHSVLPRTLSDGNAKRDNEIANHLIQNRDDIASEIATIVSEHHVDVILAHDLLWGIVQLVEPWRWVHCAVVSSLHVLNHQTLLRSASASPYLFHRCVSDHLKRRVIDSVPLPNIEVIPNSIDTTRFRPSDVLPLESRVIVCNSRIDPDKGVIDLVRGFAKFTSLVGGFELWLCAGQSPFGDRSIEFPKITAEIESLGLSRSVRMLPNLRWSDVPRLLQQAFVVVLPTYYESFGRAALEALACGVPVIATRVGNLPSLIGEAGRLIQPASPEAICQELLWLYKNPEVRSELREWGPQKAAAYDNQIVARSMLNAIAQRG